MPANGQSAATLQSQLNHSMPAAFHVMLGDLLAAVITALNAGLADVAALRTRLNSSMLTVAGLAIHGAASALVKTSEFVALVDGVPVHKAAGDLPALAGTLATGKSAAWAFYIDGSGNLSVSAKTADAASHAAAVALLPAAPDHQAMIGFVVIDNATGANFTGGTTALDTASLTVSYYNAAGPAPYAAAATQVTVGDLASR